MAYNALIKSLEPEKISPVFTNNESSENINEDLTLVWFDQYMDEIENQSDVEITKDLLRQIHRYVIFFTEPDACIDYLKSISKEKIFLIISGSYAIEYLDKIHLMQQVDSVFIFCLYLEKYSELKEKYSKVIDVFNQQSDLIDSLSKNVELAVRQASIFGLFDGKERSARYLTREAGSFLWFQLLTDVLRNITKTDKHNTGIEDMLMYCQAYYRGNRVELKNIEEFRKKYKPEDAIVWYSKQSFVYRLVNKALRTEDIDALYTFRVYITHLRNQIAIEHQKLRTVASTSKTKIIRLYRGLKLTKNEILQMRYNVGCLISMNGFFSTSRDIEQAVRFATKKSQRKEVVGVLLEIGGNIVLDKMIFADIAQYSAFPKEQEALFDLATVFKIVHVEFDEIRKLWIMQLAGVDELSGAVNEYIQSIGKETEESNSILLFSRVMCDMGEYEKSEKYLKRLLSDLPSNHDDTSKIYFNLGRVCYLRGEYKQSLEYYEEALAIQKREIHPHKSSLDIARTLHNIGNIYLDKKQISTALEYYEKALEMKRKILHDQPNHPSIATSLTAIGSVYKKRGNLSQALELLQHAYEMKKLTLAADHPSLADSLDNLGTIYEEMNNHEKAIGCYKQALKIKKQALPTAHPSISATLNNMGIVYRKEQKYDKSLSCYTQALATEQTKLSLDNLDLADTYNNLCTLYWEQSFYQKALEMAQLKLNILKKHFDDDDEQIRLTKALIDEINEEISSQSGTKAIDEDSPSTFF
ncbi:unnamed protein product [Rotaria magnacalcarata]|uniref:Uncharacterized protein n=1 Tax=Rotaria magnacalcarata TaxID=392030 RepID=A0A816NH04_9BILA|nr:unnamed protein product [Rotaria magnacalcarata]CAF2131702.1 unnamed protein product [Rotaria magnacalcarata]CAF4103701.1 unnamed protein product [Rotaria magnacalcarata]